jgi:hypothetical protein
MEKEKLEVGKKNKAKKITKKKSKQIKFWIKKVNKTTLIS